MRCTIENEELLLSLYFEVETRYDKKMKKDVKRCKWIAEKWSEAWLLSYAGGKINIMKMVEISMVLGCRRFNRSVSGWEIHRPNTTWKLAAISDKKNKLE